MRDYQSLLGKLDYLAPSSPVFPEAAAAIRALIAERDEEHRLRMKLSDDYAFAKYADSDEKLEMKQRAEAAEARLAELMKS